MKRNLKKLLAMALSATMVLSVAACSSSKKEEPADKGQTEESGTKSDIKIGLITTIGGLGDSSIGDEGYNGVKNASEVLGFEFDYSEPMTSQDLEALIIEYSESGEYDLIVTLGNESLEPVQSEQANYPDQKYLVYDIEAEHENVITEWFSKDEIGFMAGCFMALMEPYGQLIINGETKTWEPGNTYGLIIGGEYPSTVSAITGAAAGIKYIDPENEYLYAIVGDWKDQAKNKELALSMYDQGAHFIFHNAGGGCNGILEAAKERDGFFVGYDGNQNNLDPTHVVASSIKCNSDVILRVLTQFVETGELAWGTAEENGYANGGIDFVYQDGLEIPEEVSAAMEAIKEKLKAGEITPPSTWEDVETFTAVYEG